MVAMTAWRTMPSNQVSYPFEMAPTAKP